MRITFAIILMLVCYALPSHADSPYENVTHRMHALAKKFPKIVSVFSLGNNDDGIELLALRVSLTPKKQDAQKLGYLVVGGHHGNERGSVELALRFAESLAPQFQGTQLVEKQRADTEWVIIPVVNVYGLNQATRLEKEEDPNRHYPGPCEPKKPRTKLASVRAILQLTESRLFVASVATHGYTATLTYPWGITTAAPKTADDAKYYELVKEAASHTGYRFGTSTEIMFAANGTFEDYMYWKFGTWSLLAELKDESIKEIDNTVKAMFAFFDGTDRSVSPHHEPEYACANGLAESNAK